LQTFITYIYAADEHYSFRSRKLTSSTLTPTIVGLKKTPKKNTTETQEKYSDPHRALCKKLRVQRVKQVCNRTYTRRHKKNREALCNLSQTDVPSTEARSAYIHPAHVTKLTACFTDAHVVHVSAGQLFNFRFVCSL